MENIPPSPSDRDTRPVHDAQDSDDSTSTTKAGEASSGTRPNYTPTVRITEVSPETPSGEGTPTTQRTEWTTEIHSADSPRVEHVEHATWGDAEDTLTTEHAEHAPRIEPDIYEILLDRLGRLKTSAIVNRNLVPSKPIDATVVYECLDRLESLLYTPSAPGPDIQPLPVWPFTPPGIGVGANPQPSPKRDQPTPTPASKGLWNPQMTPEIMDLCNQVDILKKQFNQRCEEAFELSQIIQLERHEHKLMLEVRQSEIDARKADLQEETTERDALQGTVQGLSEWIARWQPRYDSAALARKPARTGRSCCTRKAEQPENFDAEELFEGITAWMRGWKDLEEGFRERQSARKSRSEGREIPIPEITNIQWRAVQSSKVIWMH
ncbi:hypothetical protein BJX61DRAFT_470488 [Aspergillus egyptiacus]|nr:hypothetical protein BJX61DRAFT_470488 [Aspergillus egyptiacus]